MGEYIIEISNKNYKDLDNLIKNAIRLDIKDIILRFKGDMKISKIKPHIIKALDHEDEIDIFIHDIPYCLLNNAEDHLVNQGKDKQRTDSCIDCKYKDCPGILKNYIEEFGEGEISAILDLPEEVVIEITTKCNLDCYFCFNRNVLKQRGKEISKDKVISIIDETHKAGIKIIRFTGGEPLLHPNIWELLEYAKSKGFEVRLNTNGTIISETLAQKLEKYVDNILIPLNSWSAEEEAKKTGSKDCFEKRINALKILKNTKIPIIRSGTIATKENIKKS